MSADRPPRPTRGIEMWDVPFWLAERTSRFMDAEWWRVFALWVQVVMCVEVLSVAMGW